MSLEQHLNAIFDAERALRSAERALLSGKPQDLATLLGRAVDEALSLRDREEAQGRLIRLADLCAQVPGPAMADALIRILDDDDPRVRVEAGEALTDVAYDRYAEVARAIDRALDAKLAGPAMQELPFILAEIGEPSALLLLKRFLLHAEADVVAAAIEALAELGDPEAVPMLEPFANDQRVVALDDEEDDTMHTTVGQLAQEAIEQLVGSDVDEE